jgi:hypothetical protein
LPRQYRIVLPFINIFLSVKDEIRVVVPMPGRMPLQKVKRTRMVVSFGSGRK